MRELLLIGGGRWARVLMSVLVDIVPVDWNIAWVTRHGYAAAQQWCQARQLTQVHVLEQLSLESGFTINSTAADVAPGSEQGTVARESTPRFAAAMVATSPHTHASIARQLLQAGIPTLCEKPLVLDAQHAEQLEQLALARKTPLGVNLELHFASYLERFLIETSDIDLQHVAIEWHDPWSEERYGETKYSDVYTNVVDDMLPHCWSLLRRVTGISYWEIERVACNRDTSITIELSQEGIAASVSLKRRAPQRARTINLNHSGAVLDFSSEPGWIERAAVRTELSWETARPLSRSLRSFLEVVAFHHDRDEDRVPWQSWPLSVVACRAAVELSTLAAAQLMQEQWHGLQATENNLGPTMQELRQCLLFDLFVPLAAQQGERVKFTQPDRLAEFFTGVETRLARGDQLQDFLPQHGAW